MVAVVDCGGTEVANLALIGLERHRRQAFSLVVGAVAVSLASVVSSAWSNYTADMTAAVWLSSPSLSRRWTAPAQLRAVARGRGSCGQQVRSRWLTFPAYAGTSSEYG